MEESFPYTETADQLSAIAEVKADMQSPKPMDRLVCGDVGFGKTEVALRAAFKATQDNKQVMVLCPTTILAQQHYEGLSALLEGLGVRVLVNSGVEDTDGGAIILQGGARLEADFLLVCTGWDRFWNTPEYFGAYPVLSPAAVKRAVELGVRGIGLDTMGIDPMDAADFPRHYLMFERGLVIVENLRGLSQLAGRRFFFAALPSGRRIR